MKRISVFCLLFLGLLAIANSEKLRILPLRKGMTQIPRTLETLETAPTTPTTPTGPAVSTLDSLAVATNFGLDYAYKRSLNETTREDYLMTLVISSSDTVFMQSSGPYFYDYTCDDLLCAEVENTTTSIELPFLTVKEAVQISFNFTNSTSAAIITNGSWELKSTPLMTKKSPVHPYSDDLSYDDFPKTHSTRGWIGFGTKGDAASNFKTPNPIFSFHLNKTKATGDLIFGNDDTRKSKSTPAYKLTTDENWMMSVSSIQYGNDYTYNSTGPMTLVFDTQVKELHVPPTAFTDLKGIWSTYDIASSYCTGNYQCYLNANNLSNVSNITFTLTDGTKFSIDPYHFFRGNYYSDQIPENNETKNDWYAEVGPVSTNYSGSEYIVVGYRPMSQFYSVFEKSTTGANTVTLYDTVPYWENATYTAPTPDSGSGNGSGDGTGTGNGSGDGTGTGNGNGDGTTDNSGDSSYYYIYGGILAAVIIAFVIVACCCCKNERPPPAKKTLTVELRGADKSTESSVASSVRL